MNLCTYYYSLYNINSDFKEISELLWLFILETGRNRLKLDSLGHNVSYILEVSIQNILLFLQRALTSDRHWEILKISIKQKEKTGEEEAYQRWQSQNKFYNGVITFSQSWQDHLNKQCTSAWPFTKVWAAQLNLLAAWYLTEEKVTALCDPYNRIMLWQGLIYSWQMFTTNYLSWLTQSLVYW